ncbi:MAG: HIT family protein [Erysipelotrichaceae bacterium]|jgi:histidine triad (HIT) family protein|nr:HIT family protein [Erysipelotrichaceae bacterium]
MKDCVFCKIANGMLPSTKVYEDDDVIAILDINPATRGHTLVMPKTHYDNFLSTPREILTKVMIVAQRLGQIAMKQLHARGVNILTNCYPVAGQSVLHFHVHVIPRYDTTDGLQISMKDMSEEKINLPTIAKEITKGM